jgi:transposase InsO family protein
LGQSDNGSEFTGRVLDQWTHERGVKMQFIEPGKPIQNAFIESFNSRLRVECLTNTSSSRSTKIQREKGPRRIILERHLAHTRGDFKRFPEMFEN